MKELPKPKIEHSVTNDFKMGMVVLVFFITCFHLYQLLYFPETTLVSERILLGIVLFAVTYLWIQEVQDRKKLEILADELLIAQEELKEANIAAMKTLIISEEARDPYLSGHSRRVTRYAMAIADRMNLSDLEKKHIEYAGYLHDIGKIGISDSILHKKGPLDTEEWKVIKEHPVKALDILASLKFLPDEKIIIRHHHERYDGGGYPDGLKGKDIPLGSRIMAIADSFDAMNSKRPYRPPLSKEKIISELKELQGRQFDSEVVDIFLDVIQTDESIFKDSTSSSD